MINKRTKTYLLVAAIILALLIYNLDYPLNIWLSDKENDFYIPGGHREGDEMQTTTAADQYDFLYGKEFQDALDRAATTPKKNILFWHPKGNFYMTLTSQLGRDCGYCNIVNDLALIEDKKTEAVVFFHEHITPDNMPHKRNPKQYWVYRTGEPPPAMAKAGMMPYADQIGFNLTMTYRTDADIRIYYGYLSEMNLPHPKQILQNKKHLALIVTSDCSYLPVAKLRMELIQMLLREGLSLSTSGSCFPNSKQFPRGSDDELLQFTSQHKFYLAFENSYHCKDYVSEKFFRAIQVGTVPVVWGAKKADYSRFVPESGFIFVEEFSTLKELVQYLNFLDKNDGEYMKYFEWRKKAPTNLKETTFICQLCRLLHGIKVDDAYAVPYSEISKDPKSYVSDKLGPRTIKSLQSWWLNRDNPDCLRTDMTLNKNGRVIFG